MAKSRIAKRRAQLKRRKYLRQLWDAMEGPLFTRNVVLTAGLGLFPILVGCLDGKSAAALSLLCLYTTVPVCLVSSLVGKYLPLWVRPPLSAVLAAGILLLVDLGQPWLLRTCGIPGYLMAVGTVMLSHASDYAPGHVLLGVGLCLVAYWTRSVWYTMLWHLIQNGIAMVISYYSGEILQASQSAAGMDASAMLAQQPLLMAMSATMLLLTFGAGAAACLALLWLTARRHREQPIPRAEGKVHPLAWSPLLIAAGCIAYQYVSSGIVMWGGAA